MQCIVAGPFWIALLVLPNLGIGEAGWGAAFRRFPLMRGRAGLCRQ